MEPLVLQEIRAELLQSRAEVLALNPTTEGPSWGHSKVVLGAIRSFLEPFCEHLSPNVIKIFKNRHLIEVRRARRGPKPGCPM
jgi:hypothetical protein